MISLVALVYNCTISLDCGAFAIIFSFAELSAEKFREVLRKTKWKIFDGIYHEEGGGLEFH